MDPTELITQIAENLSIEIDGDGDDETHAMSRDASANIKQSICYECQKIDFSSALMRQLPYFNKIIQEVALPESTFVSQLEHYSTSCRLCRLLWMTQCLIGYERAKSYHLRVFPFPSTHEVAQEILSIISPGGTAWLQTMPNDGHQPRSDDLWPDRPPIARCSSRAGVNGWLAWYPTNEWGTFRPHPIIDHFNASLVKHWLSACAYYHGSACKNSTIMDRLLLIDCGLLQLCNALESSQYVALNYVWGKQVPRESTKSPDIPTDEDWHLPRFERLSQVVKDAILVTKRLGYRYLWVDKYCINQRDAAMKDYQIDNMHLVYMGQNLP